MIWQTLILSGLLIIIPTQAATNVGGVLLQNTIWTTANSANPYSIISDVQIPRNVTLTIQSGVIINFGQGDFEILVKGFLKINGISGQPVIFQNGSAADQKCMIKFQSTGLPLSSINYAQFTGPKKALQLADVAGGIQKNTGNLTVQSSTFLGNTAIEANGNYPENDLASVPSLEFRSCSLTQTTISTANQYGESIRIISSNIFYATIIPRVFNKSIEINNCTVRHTIINYGQTSQATDVKLYNSNAINTTVIGAAPYTWPVATFTSIKSVIQDFKIVSGDYLFGSQTTFIFQDSTIYNVSAVGSGIPYNTISQSSFIVRNSKFTLGNLILKNADFYTNSISINDSSLTKVNFTLINPDNYQSNPQSLLTMRNASFVDGVLILPRFYADIAYSTITLIAPFSIGGNSLISCSSIGRSGLIQQANSVGINALGLNLTDSTIKNFGTGLRITPPYLNTATVAKTNFISNSLYNIDNKGVYNVTATGVYWGTNNAGVIVSKINDYWDNINYGDVIYTNYATKALSAEAGCPAYKSD